MERYDKKKKAKAGRGRNRGRKERRRPRGESEEEDDGLHLYEEELSELVRLMDGDSNTLKAFA